MYLTKNDVVAVPLTLNVTIYAASYLVLRIQMNVFDLKNLY